MLKAWNTGHPGGISTLHASSPTLALYRLEQLIQEAVVTVPRDLISLAIDIIVFLEGRGSRRHVSSIHELQGLDNYGLYQVRQIDTPEPAGIAL